jgi:hypothetical protein
MHVFFSRVDEALRLKPTYTTAALSASKNDARFKKGQNWLKNNQLILFILIHDTLCRLATQHVTKV